MVHLLGRENLSVQLRDASCNLVTYPQTFGIIRQQRTQQCPHFESEAGPLKERLHFQPQWPLHLLCPVPVHKAHLLRHAECFQLDSKEAGDDIKRNKRVTILIGKARAGSGGLQL